MGWIPYSIATMIDVKELTFVRTELHSKLCWLCGDSVEDQYNSSPMNFTRSNSIDLLCLFVCQCVKCVTSECVTPPPSSHHLGPIFFCNILYQYGDGAAQERRVKSMAPDEEIATDTMVLFFTSIFSIFFFLSIPLSLWWHCYCDVGHRGIYVHIYRYAGSHAGYPLVIDSWSVRHGPSNINPLPWKPPWLSIDSFIYPFVYRDWNCVSQWFSHSFHFWSWWRW